MPPSVPATAPRSTPCNCTIRPAGSPAQRSKASRTPSRGPCAVSRAVTQAELPVAAHCARATGRQLATHRGDAPAHRDVRQSDPWMRSKGAFAASRDGVVRRVAAKCPLGALHGGLCRKSMDGQPSSGREQLPVRGLVLAEPRVVGARGRAVAGGLAALLARSRLRVRVGVRGRGQPRPSGTGRPHHTLARLGRRHILGGRNTGGRNTGARGRVSGGRVSGGRVGRC